MTNTATGHNKQMLRTLRDTFHLSLLPQKGAELNSVQAQIMRNELSKVLFLGGNIAGHLDIKTENGVHGACAVLGTTHEIVDRLHKLFGAIIEGRVVPANLATDLQREQKAFNAVIQQSANPLTKAIAPDLAFPPVKAKAGGFGY